MKSGKVQTNRYDVNILVETKNSSNTHYSNLDFAVEVEKVLTDEDIIEIWRNRDRTKTSELELAREWIKKEQGYSVSNLKDDSLNIKHSSIIQYIV